MREGRVGRSVVVIAALVVAGVSLVLMADTRLFAIAFQPKDDGLFLRIGASVRAGEWLGPLDNLTLVKGMMYPILVAIADALSVPLKLAEMLVYLGGAAVMSWVAGRLSGRAWLGLVLFAVLALDPVWFHDVLMRVTRQSVYAGMSMMLVAGCAWIFLVRLEDARPWRARDLVAGLLVGVAGGIYWLVREEGEWLVPSVALMALVALGRTLLRTRSSVPEPRLSEGVSIQSSRRRRGLLDFVVGSLALLIGAVAVVGGIMLVNQSYYGVALANDWRDGAFPKAYQALTRVEIDPWKRYRAMSPAERDAAYAVSPAFAELEEYLNRREAGSAANGCRSARASVFIESRGIELSCDEYFPGWFPWVLRDAIQAAGHWESASQSQEFMERIATEMETACAQDLLPCGRRMLSVFPLRPEFVGEVISLIPDAFWMLAATPVPLGSHPSDGTDLELLDIARFTHSQLAPPEHIYSQTGDLISITGLVASPLGTPSVHVLRTESQPLEARIDSRIDPGVAGLLEAQGIEGFADGQAASDEPWNGGIRFSVQTDCVADDCHLAIDHGDGTSSRQAIWALEPGWTEWSDGAVLRVLEVAPALSREAELLRQVAPLRNDDTVAIQRFVKRMYAMWLPILTLLALVGSIAALLVPGVRRRYGMLIVLAAATGGAVLTRFGLIGLIEVTGWPGAISIGKLSPASPFLITFACLGSFLALAVAAHLIMRISTSRRQMQRERNEP